MTRRHRGSRVTLGLQLPSFTYPGGPTAIPRVLAEVAMTAEEAGFDSLWVMDHLFQLPVETGWGGPEEPMLEAYTTLGFLARVTQRVRLGALVGCAFVRHPALLVKAATTLDILSDGRAMLGLGAGWYAREAIGLGIGFPSRSDRFVSLEDTARLARHMWDGRRDPFVGRGITLPEPILSPLPTQAGGPPILIGGGGERRTLRLVAEVGDACNILVPDPGESRHKLEVLRRHCDDLRRDYDEIEKTALVEVDLRAGRMRPRDALGVIEAQAAEGIEHVIVNMPDVHDLKQLATLGREVIPALGAPMMA